MSAYKKILYILLIISCIGIASIVIKKRAAIYRYDVEGDYAYSFEQANAEIVNLNLKDGRLTLPKSNNTRTSDFLKITINSTFVGKFLQPSLDISIGDSSFTQYFEQGAKGIRYINISHISSKNRIEVALKGQRISFDDQAVQLVRFKSPEVEKLKVLVLAAHPDDAEIAAYGLYSDVQDTYIITATAGDAGDHKYNEIYPNIEKHYLAKGKLRTWDSLTVPLLAKVNPEHIVNLGFFDGTLPTMFKNKSKAVSGLYTNEADINTFRKQNTSSLSAGLTGDSSWNSLVENIRYLLDKINPDIIVTAYPVLDNHDDHKLVSIALFEAIKASNVTDGQLYLYSNHASASEYFPYGTSGGTISLPPNFEDNIYFDSVYSHPLPRQKQKDKILALDAMHDLRLDTEWRFFGGALKNLFNVIVENITGQDDSYYRRAVRSNELFFVVKINNLYDENIYNTLTAKNINK